MRPKPLHSVLPELNTEQAESDSVPVIVESTQPIAEIPRIWPLWLSISLSFVLLFLLGIWVYWTGAKKDSDLQTRITDIRNNISLQSATDVVYLKIMLLRPVINPDFAYQIAGLVAEYSRKRSVDVDLVLAIIDVESRFSPDAVSRMGALGLMQVMPFWIRVRDIEGDLKDPEVNIKHGTAILASYLEAYQDLEIAVTVYNRGPMLVNKDIKAGRDPKNQYVEDVMLRYRKLKTISGKLRN